MFATQLNEDEYPMFNKNMSSSHPKETRGKNFVALLTNVFICLDKILFISLSFLAHYAKFSMALQYTLIDQASAVCQTIHCPMSVNFYINPRKSKHGWLYVHLD